MRPRQDARAAKGEWKRRNNYGGNYSRNTKQLPDKSLKCILFRKEANRGENKKALMEKQFSYVVKLVGAAF